MEETKSFEELEQVPEQITKQHYIGPNIIDIDTVFCSICLDIIKNATALQNCRHMFCKKCITEYIESSTDDQERCPICKTDFDATFSFKHQDLIISKVDFKCPYTVCIFVGVHDNMISHLTSCLFSLYKYQ